jgi:hypothetical protein
MSELSELPWQPCRVQRDVSHLFARLETVQLDSAAPVVDLSVIAGNAQLYWDLVSLLDRDPGRHAVSRVSVATDPNIDRG